MRFSLIMATMGRAKEVIDFMTALQHQSFKDFELIVVDQNDDDRLVPICDRFWATLPIHYHRSSVKRNTHARNAGMRFCRGEIIGFPDDDCVYPEGLLLSVHRAFLEDPRLDILTGTSRSPSGSISGRWRKTAGEIGLDTVWTSVIEFNLFIKAPLLTKLQGFDERLGVGSRFGSCEGPDLVLRALSLGARAIYNPANGIIHPEKIMTAVAIERAFDYGAGMGYVIRKHRIKLSIYMAFFVRPLGGMLLSFAKLRLSAGRYYWNTLRGRVFGFRSYSA